MIIIIDWVCRGLLIIIYALSGVTKIRDIEGTRQAIKNFGINNTLVVKIGSYLLPIFELLVSVLLLFAQSAYVGGIISTILLLIFSGGIINLIRRNILVDCHCFGQLQISSTGWHNVVRNALLLLFSLIVAICRENSTSFLDLFKIETERLIFFLFFCLFVGQSLILMWLLDKNEALKERLEVVERDYFRGLPIGSKAPEFEVLDYKGARVTLAHLLKYKKTWRCIKCNAAALS